MSDEEDVSQEQRDAARREREAQINDMRAVLATAQGRRFLWWMMGKVGTYSASYAPGDALASAFNEGQRNVGIMLEAEIGAADPEALIVMQTEALIAARAKRAARSD